jgi:hypothetical protein
MDADKHVLVVMDTDKPVPAVQVVREFTSSLKKNHNLSLNFFLF